MMRIPGSGSARRAWRRVFPERGPAAVVLAYHRVALVERDPQLLCVSPEMFDDHLAALSERFTIVGLTELLDAMDERRVQDRSVVITFDDGYVDALVHAEPALARAESTGTVFVTAGQVGSDREFWWDEIEALVLAPGVMPSALSLDTPTGAFTFDLAGEEELTVEAAEAVADWNVTQPPATARQRLYLSLCEVLRPLSRADRESVLNQLRAGREPAVRDSHRALTTPELSVIEKRGAMSVGAHTVSHQLLSARTAAEQADEITGSKRMLEQWCGHEIPIFAYPYGVPGDFDATSAALVREAGFRCGCANDPGLARARTDRFRLPRYLVRPCSGAELARSIEGWFDGRE